MRDTTWCRLAVTGVVLPGMLLSALACGGKLATEEPLAPVPTSVAADEIEPVPLRVEWKWSPPERDKDQAAEWAVSHAPALDERSVYVPSGARVRAHALKDGTLRWQARFSSNVALAPVVTGNGVVVATEDAHLLWLDVDGTVRATVSLAATPADATAAGEAVVLATGEGLQAWRRTEAGGAADKAWELALPGAQVLSGDPGDSLLLVPLPDGTLVAVDPATGRELWRRAEITDPKVRPTLAGERIFVVAPGGRLYALRRRDGRRVWRAKELGVEVAAAPAYADGVVWVAALDAALHGFSARTGSHLFRVPLSSRCYVDLRRWGHWILSGPEYGPWLLVHAPLRSAGPADPGQPRSMTIRSDDDIQFPAAVGADGVVLVDTSGSVRLLRAGPAPDLNQRP